MPELPEVEVVRRGLDDTVRGHAVEQVVVREARLRWPVPDTLGRVLRGAALSRIERRGKYLLMTFAPGVLLVHLGMSGNFRFHRDRAPPPGAHDHVDLVFAHGVLRYHDPRRFGAMVWHPAMAGAVAQHPLLSRLGVEPLSPAFDGAALHRGTRGRTASIKQVLLAGDVVVGVGNIYASESLFRARIRPATPANRLGRERCARLAAEIRETLAEAIERGGSTLRDFVASDGAAGCYQVSSFVYDREGEPCRVCGAPIRMMRQQQRSTYWCARCQH